MSIQSSVFKNENSRHNELKACLLDQIGRSDCNMRLPSETALAKQFNVCRATMNKVMVELEREGYVVRRPGKGTFVSPRDKTVESSAARNGSRTVMIAYPDFFAYPLWQAVHFAEMLALKQNLRLINFKMQAETDYATLFHVIQQNPDLEGILMIPPATGMPRPVLRQLDTLNLPCVLQISQENVSIYRNLCTIDWDHFKSGYLRMKALLARGHRKIGFVENEPGRLAATDRGIHHAMREYGLRQQHLLRSKIAASPWKDPVETGYHQTAELLEHHPELTALLVDTFPGAYGALRAIDERGLRCPADVSLVTAMDMMSYGRLSRPALTTVLGNSEALIERMFQMILGGRSDVPRHVVQDVELIERESIRTLS